MLGDSPGEGEPPLPATSVITELLARNIAARNPCIEPGSFPEIVNTLVFTIVAARLLEESCVTGSSSLQPLIVERGLADGIYSFFFGVGTRQTLRRSGHDTWQPPGSYFQVPDLVIDTGVIDEVFSVTRGDRFFMEWIKDLSDEREAALSLFLRRNVRLSSGNRALIEEIPRKEGFYRTRTLPLAFVQQIAEEALIERLSGKTPATAAQVTVLDPCCGTGRFLAASYRVLHDWHLGWYREHLVPLLEEGRDPFSRRVQEILPRIPSPGSTTGKISFGSNPLPVSGNPEGIWKLTLDEKIRIIGGSLFGIDIDPRACMISRLTLLALLLQDTGPDEKDSFGPGMVINTLFKNIYCGNTLARPGYHERSRGVNSWVGGGEGDSPLIEEAFSGVIRGGGFEIVMGALPAELKVDRSDMADYLSGHYQVRKVTSDAAPFFIERGMSFLKKGGLLCMTGPGRWLTASSAAPLRTWLQQYQIDKIVDFRDLSCTSRTKNPPVLTCIIKIPELHPFRAVLVTDGTGETGSCYTPRRIHLVSQAALSGKPWVLHDLRPERIRWLIKKKGTPLGQIVMGEHFSEDKEVPCWAVISRKTCEEVFRKDPVAKSWIIPYVLKEDISRYAPLKPDKFLVMIPKGTTGKMPGHDNDLWGRFRKYHHTLARVLKNRLEEAGLSLHEMPGCWWEWGGLVPPSFLNGPTLLFREGSPRNRPGWTIARSRVYPGPGVLALPGGDRTLLGILNSKVFWFYKSSTKRSVLKTRYTARNLFTFPVYIPDRDDPRDIALCHEIAVMVQQRYGIFKACGQVQSEDEKAAVREHAKLYNNRIDQLVDDLYGLSEEDSGVKDYYLSGPLGKGDNS